MNMIKTNQKTIFKYALLFFSFIFLITTDRSIESLFVASVGISIGFFVFYSVITLKEKDKSFLDILLYVVSLLAYITLGMYLLEPDLFNLIVSGIGEGVSNLFIWMLEH